MKNKLSTWISLILLTIMLFSHTSIALASMVEENNAEDAPNPAIETQETNKVVLDTKLSQTPEGHQTTEGPTTQEHQRIIAYFQAVLKESRARGDDDTTGRIPFISHLLGTKPHRLALEKTTSSSSGVHVSYRDSELKKGYWELSLETTDDQPLDRISLSFKDEVDVVKILYSDEALQKIEALLEEVDSDSAGERHELTKRLKAIKPTYCLDDEGLKVCSEDTNALGRQLVLENNGKDRRQYKLLLKVDDNHLDAGETALKLKISRGGEEDQFSLICPKDTPTAAKDDKKADSETTQDDDHKTPLKSDERKSLQNWETTASSHEYGDVSAYYGEDRGRGDITVRKKWSGGNAGHDAVTVHVYGTYRIYFKKLEYRDHYDREREIKSDYFDLKDVDMGTLTLSSGNNWSANLESENSRKQSYTERDLEEYFWKKYNPRKIKKFQVKRVESFNYSFSEEEVEGYRSSINKDDNGNVTITNTADNPQPNPGPGDGKIINVNKTWSNGNAGHDAVTVHVYGTYRIYFKKLEYRDHYDREREIKSDYFDLKDVDMGTLTLSSGNNWSANLESENSRKQSYTERDLEEYFWKKYNPRKIKKFQVKRVESFNYSFSEEEVEGYRSSINKDDNGNVTITNTADNPPEPNPPEPNPPEPKPGEEPEVWVNKQIDYLDDGVTNKDTTIQSDAKYKDKKDDLYRLYLDVKGTRVIKTKPVDLLFVLDGSSSMRKRDMTFDGRELSRKEAMMKMINETQLVPNFLKQNEGNRVAFVYFDGDTKNNKDHSQASQGYKYTDDARVLQNWSHTFHGVDFSLDSRSMGTNYQAGLMVAGDLLEESEREQGRKRIMIFISDGVPTYWIDKYGNRRENGNYTNPTTVRNSEVHMKTFVDGFLAYHKDLVLHTVGVSSDISLNNPNTSQSPVVLKYMAEHGGGQYIGVDSDMSELAKKLKRTISTGITGVKIEDTLSEKVDFLVEKPDFKIIKKTKNAEIALYENGQWTEANGTGDNAIITALDYDPNSKKIALTFHKDYELEEDTKYIISYNVKVNQQAKDDYLNGKKYDAIGDEATDYGSNKTSSKKAGFKSNKSAVLTYKGGQVSYPHPVIQVKATPGRELPTTGGVGTAALKLSGSMAILVTGIASVKRKKKH